ncbi:sigma-B regulation protein RsbQ [Hymenobacter luteus]|uniref:Sigma-B regulation protein RsbQ n=2 Tax=Hymenobacter TaxID=89966 RepID=A0A7W9WBZ4_9BACT|nr:MULTISPECIES: alpha/beta hydrolase [Hymenobacter]MBB4600853.1 sigma-B regulation protein RsbQ [Hymenobacter latericoloratus]MBB6058940.1 sigma-B regulation protein RsbQ [Hymenobacter luteus]
MDILKRHHVSSYGSGVQPILFSHGFGTDQHAWQYVAPAFAARHRVVLFDLVGAGSSDKAAYDFTRYNTLEGYADDLVTLLRALQLPKAVYVGHSVSGMIGVLAAIRAPELFERLVLLAASPCYLNDGDYSGGFEATDLEELLGFLDRDYRAWSNTMVPNLVGGDMRPELVDEVLDSFSRVDPAIARQFARATFLSDYRSQLAQLQVPSLIIQCADDSVAPAEVGHYLHDHLAGSTLEILNTTGHYPHLSAPVATIACLERYLRATWPSAN